jgi:hypothetical protein
VGEKKEPLKNEIMMTHRHIFPVALMLILAVLMFSCSIDEPTLQDDASDGQPAATDDQAVNIPEWIYDEMSIYYYWNETLPESYLETGNEPT